MIDQLIGFSLLANVILLFILLLFRVSQKSVYAKSLVGEAHHSLKNSAQMLMNIINIQNRNNSSKESALSLLSNSVKAISAMHEKLYNPCEGHVCCSNYITDLLKCFNGANMEELSISTRLTPVSMPAEQLMALGIVVNELVTNCVKYATASNRPLKVDVKSVVANETLELTVSDNGPGIESNDSNGHGHAFIKKIIGSLNGSISLMNSPKGLTVKILLPIK